VGLLQQHLLHSADRQGRTSALLCNLLVSKFIDAQCNGGRDASCKLLDKSGGLAAVARLFRASAVQCASSSELVCHFTNAHSHRGHATAPARDLLFALLLHAVCIDGARRSPDHAQCAGTKTPAALKSFDDVVAIFFAQDCSPFVSALFHYAVSVHTGPWDCWSISTFGVAVGGGDDYDAVQRIFQHVPDLTISAARVVHRFLKQLQLTVMQPTRRILEHDVWGKVEALAARMAEMMLDTDRQSTVAMLDAACGLVTCAGETRSSRKCGSARSETPAAMSACGSVGATINTSGVGPTSSKNWTQVLVQTTERARTTFKKAAPKDSAASVWVCLHLRAIAAAASSAAVAAHAGSTTIHPIRLHDDKQVLHDAIKVMTSREIRDAVASAPHVLQQHMLESVGVLAGLVTACARLAPGSAPSFGGGNNKENKKKNKNISSSSGGNSSSSGSSSGSSRVSSLRNHILELAKVLLAVTAQSSAALLQSRVQLSEWRNQTLLADHHAAPTTDDGGKEAEENEEAEDENETAEHGNLRKDTHDRVEFDEILANDRNVSVARHGARRSLKHMRQENRHQYLEKLEQVLRRAQDVGDERMIADELFLWNEMRR
jgi:hypothetical protein